MVFLQLFPAVPGLSGGTTRAQTTPRRVKLLLEYLSDDERQLRTDETQESMTKPASGEKTRSKKKSDAKP